MKKVGFLLGSLTGAGAEKTIITLANNIALMENRVFLFVLSDRADYKAPENVKVFLLSSKNPSQNLQKTLEELGGLDLFITSRPEFYDVKLAKNIYCSVHITPTAWLKKRNWYARWKTWLQKHKLKKKYQNKKLIALSEGIKNDLVRNLACEDADVQVINNPFEFDTIKKKADELGSLPRQPYIIYVAAMVARKRHTDLLRAFSQFEDKTLSLVFVGKGDEEQNLKELAEELNVASRVVFWGWDANPYRLIKNADVSVLASEAEGLPRVLVESIALGVSVVSTDCPSGPNEVLTNNNAKYLVPVGDINKLTEVLQEVLEMKTKQEIDISRFNAENIAKKYLGLIQ